MSGSFTQSLRGGESGPKKDPGGKLRVEDEGRNLGKVKSEGQGIQLYGVNGGVTLKKVKGKKKPLRPTNIPPTIAANTTKESKKGPQVWIERIAAFAYWP